MITKALDAIQVPARNVSVYDLRRYLSNEKKRGLADTSLEGTRQVINAFYNWLMRENLIKTNPAANLGAIKCAKVLRKAYTDIELEKLKSHCRSKRDLAMVMFMAATGCRVSEMTSLNRDKVDLNKMECLVHGKGNKERTVYLNPISSMALKDYLDSRDDDSEALFAGHGTERLSAGAVRRMLKTVGEAAGVNKVHPHKFRRTLATNLIRHGMPIEEVASILGHDRLDTTMAYVMLCKDNVKNDYLKYV